MMLEKRMGRVYKDKKQLIKTKNLLRQNIKKKMGRVARDEGCQY